jgi:hypothetical protein
VPSDTENPVNAAGRLCGWAADGEARLASREGVALGDATAEGETAEGEGAGVVVAWDVAEEAAAAGDAPVAAGAASPPASPAAASAGARAESIWQRDMTTPSTNA